MPGGPGPRGRYAGRHERQGEGAWRGWSRRATASSAGTCSTAGNWSRCVEAIHAGPGPTLLERLGDLEALTADARAALAAEHRAGGESVVELYRAHHAEELEADEIEACFGGEDAWRTEIAVFLEHCALTGVAVLLAGDEPSLMVDLQLGGEMTDQVLCVTWDPDGRLLHVDMES